MKLHNSTRFISFLIVVIFKSSCAASQYYTGYLQDSCRCVAISELRCSPFVLSPLEGSAGFVLLSRDSRFSREFYCTYTVRAPADMTILLRINSLQLPMFGTSCRASVLKLFDGNSTEHMDKQLVGMCGSALPTQTAFTSATNEITLTYQQSADIAQQPKSFNMTFTYFTTRTKGCLETEFTCKSTGICIAMSLLCDGVENCIDGSDESKDYETCGRHAATSNPLIGTTAGLTVFLMAISLLLGLAANRAKHNRRLNSNCASTPSSGHDSSSAVPCLPTNEANHAASRRIESVIAEQLDNLASGDLLHHQTLILVNGRHHVTVVAVPETRDIRLTPPPSVVRSTPPPPYESLFPASESVPAEIQLPQPNDNQ